MRLNEGKFTIDEKGNVNIKGVLSRVPTPEIDEVETQIKQCLKGFTIEQALDILDNVKKDLVYNAPISNGLRQVI
ncbi:hypothetical protein ACW73O_11635 [Faecalibacterium prausnitzii]